MAYKCSTTDCDFATDVLADLHTHDRESKVGGLLGCPSLTCGLRFCTRPSLDSKSKGHFYNCDKFADWAKTAKQGWELSSDRLRNTCLRRAQQIADSTLDKPMSWNSGLKGLVNGRRPQPEEDELDQENEDEGEGDTINLASTSSTSGRLQIHAGQGAPSSTDSRSKAEAQEEYTPMAGGLTLRTRYRWPFGGTTPSRDSTSEEDQSNEASSETPTSSSKRGSKRKADNDSEDVDEESTDAFSARGPAKKRSDIEGSSPSTAAAPFGDEILESNESSKAEQSNTVVGTDVDEDTIRVAHPSRIFPLPAPTRASKLKHSKKTKSKASETPAITHACSFCAEQFPTLEHARHHVEISNLAPRFFCPACSFTICTGEQLEAHLKTCIHLKAYMESKGNFSHPRDDYSSMINTIVYYDGPGTEPYKITDLDDVETEEESQEREAREDVIFLEHVDAEVVSLSEARAAEIRGVRGIQ